MKYAILETKKRVNRAGGERFSMNWVYVASQGRTGMTDAGSDRADLREPSDEFFYSDKSKAEADAQRFRNDNARAVERYKRCRPWSRTYPSTVEIVEFDQ